MENISIIGAGSWGTAIAVLLAGKGMNIKLWARDDKLIEKIRSTRENYYYLPGTLLADNILVSSDIEYCCRGSEVIVLASPSHAMRDICCRIKGLVSKEQVIVSLAKGIENDTLLRMSEIIKELMPENEVAVVSGPSHAEEVAKGIPTAVVASSQKKAVAEYIQDIFMAPLFRVYTNPDIVGVELGGALKNIIALGAGIIDGLGLGDNTKAAVMTRGIVEMARLGESLGASRSTFAGLSGIGDLIVTCTSMHSRNRKAGMAIGQGKSVDEVLGGTKMVVEGVRTTKSARQLAHRQKVEMPITQEIYSLLFNKADIKNSIMNLTMRSRTHEMEELAENKIFNW
ncbi:MAG TPA: NAD(P)H-dependent glycerol-3-phosphate dehydrogenase [Bacillota bacterium]|nr:NAD(P)H-dependent glycerol-3-phosphate dehydrogenase [Bacillota bacterium]HOR85439.1 NAD(P)H-dependent glycerol-3-phosphate dehydrogenase [Bacillota bacterium]HPL52831.1 NAD(P)H-dependent glycerol-3-phosphate dehydrogenase [Bacillota bacterium]